MITVQSIHGVAYYVPSTADSEMNKSHAVFAPAEHTGSQRRGLLNKSVRPRKQYMQWQEQWPPPSPAVCLWTSDLATLCLQLLRFKVELPVVLL